ncbi:rRNA methyltransferase [Prochlorococcus marinus str. MU1402]|uniref:tRNA (cytidine(34)-2'-O)-methyltransferase n=1 Tax=Prochlorococcus marinus TaxID=1219 RepID=UPI001ADCE528|nr:tRNA (cytidine(34)-2'-O)-methyltransferase [Prochlorococcus marinus]MBO8232001.1 tRNA (cytidine(34)-2'-O)-methyltransferase [Prochlorococcus marinus XMU1402]MBW3056747.1 rRNA methyltransferase [Prochlorococcus marinus str. MU1402]
MEVALFEPRIPQNTGNIARSCAAFNIPLNLIEPLGFKLEDKYLKRAGLDYWPLVTVNKYGNFDKFLASKEKKRIISFSKKNGIYLKDFRFHKDDILLFGREDSGLPDCIIDKSDILISIFMPNLQTRNNDQKGVRSLNLSVACGIAIYEAHKQINFQYTN